MSEIRTVEDLRAAERKLMYLFTLVEANAEIEAGCRADGDLGGAEAAADRGERMSDQAEDLSDAIATARHRNSWGPY